MKTLENWLDQYILRIFWSVIIGMLVLGSLQIYRSCVILSPPKPTITIVHVRTPQEWEVLFQKLTEEKK